MSTRAGADVASPPARTSVVSGSEPGEDDAPLPARWALRRALYGLDSAASSPGWQTAFLLVLAVALTVVGGAVLHHRTVQNSMHTNYEHDTSYSVRRLQYRHRTARPPSRSDRAAPEPLSRKRPRGAP
jgi:hypothetical protein